MLKPRSSVSGAMGSRATWKRRALLVRPDLRFVFVVLLARVLTGAVRVASTTARCIRCLFSLSRRRRTSSLRLISFFSLIHYSERYAMFGHGLLYVPSPVRSNGRPDCYTAIHSLPTVWDTC